MRLQEAFLQLLLDFHSGGLMREVMMDSQIRKHISGGQSMLHFVH